MADWLPLREVIIERGERYPREYLSSNWCPLPASFPFEGKEHKVPCIFTANHKGPCQPERNQRYHDCERNRCDL